MAPSSDMILSPSPAAQVANMYRYCRATAVRIKGERRDWFILFCDLLWLFIFEEWCNYYVPTSVPDPDPPYPDPLAKGTYPRIRICTKMPPATLGLKTLWKSIAINSLWFPLKSSHAAGSMITTAPIATPHPKVKHLKRTRLLNRIRIWFSKPYFSYEKVNSNGYGTT